MSNENEKPPTHAPGDDVVIDERLAFTRRTFLAATGGAVAATTLLPSVARADAPTDPVPANAILRIHPSIGIARVGNADSSQFFVGPELPGFAPVHDGTGTAVPNYKTADGKVKPQGARFRIFEYRHNGQGKLAPYREVTLGTPGVAAITWSAHLANKKASAYENDGGAGENRPYGALRNAYVTDPAQRKLLLEFDFGPRTISGASRSGVAFDLASSPGSYPATRPTTNPEQLDYLGELRTDANGRLIVLGGKGKSGYSTAAQPELPHWANNDYWFDDAADGPVTATVALSGGGDVAMDVAGNAWVLCGPPDFAPGIAGPVTGYDFLLDLAVRTLALPIDDAAYEPGGPLHKLKVLQDQYSPGAARELPTYVPSFPDEIRPMLVAAYNLWWVNALVTAKHNSLLDPKLGDPAASNNRARERVLSYMRTPEGVTGPTGPRTMPKLMGDDPYLGGLPDYVRNLAMTHIQYAMLARWADGAFSSTDAPPASGITPHGLDQAALETCVGGAFFPGIEWGWQMRNPDLFIEPFRIMHGAAVAFYGQPPAPIGPGHFTRQMAVPWQADFNDCRNEGNYGWWPTQRPAHALPGATATRRLDWARASDRFEGGNRESTHEDMVRHWSKFGFVLEDGNQFIEKERAASIP